MCNVRTPTKRRSRKPRVGSLAWHEAKWLEVVRKPELLAATLARFSIHQAEQEKRLTVLRESTICLQNAVNSVHVSLAQFERVIETVKTGASADVDASHASIKREVETVRRQLLGLKNEIDHEARVQEVMLFGWRPLSPEGRST